MGEFKKEIEKEIMKAPEGEVDEKELQELANADAEGGVPIIVPVTIAASTAFCPTIKCTSKC